MVLTEYYVLMFVDVLFIKIFPVVHYAIDRKGQVICLVVIISHKILYVKNFWIKFCVELLYPRPYYEIGEKAFYPITFRGSLVILRQCASQYFHLHQIWNSTEGNDLCALLHCFNRTFTYRRYCYLSIGILFILKQFKLLMDVPNFVFNMQSMFYCFFKLFFKVIFTI